MCLGTVLPIMSYSTICCCIEVPSSIIQSYCVLVRTCCACSLYFNVPGVSEVGGVGAGKGR